MLGEQDMTNERGYGGGDGGVRECVRQAGVGPSRGTVDLVKSLR